MNNIIFICVSVFKHARRSEGLAKSDVDSYHYYVIGKKAKKNEKIKINKTPPVNVIRIRFKSGTTSLTYYERNVTLLIKIITVIITIILNVRCTTSTLTGVICSADVHIYFVVELNAKTKSMRFASSYTRI